MSSPAAKGSASPWRVRSSAAPRSCCLDEPLGALDKKLREEMQLELRALQQSLGITFIFVTHDQEEAMTLSDRIAVMSGGKTLQIAELQRRSTTRPVNVEVAEFIGQMNFIEATITDRSGGRRFLDMPPGSGASRRRHTRDFVQKGARVFAAIRPEKLDAVGPT